MAEEHRRSYIIGLKKDYLSASLCYKLIHNHPLARLNLPAILQLQTALYSSKQLNKTSFHWSKLLCISEGWAAFSFIPMTPSQARQRVYEFLDNQGIDTKPLHKELSKFLKECSKAGSQKTLKELQDRLILSIDEGNKAIIENSPLCG